MNDVALIPDKDVARDTWIQHVQPIARAGKLETLPTRRARNKRERSVARETDRLLSQRTFMLPEGAYQKIDWGHA